MLRLRSKLTAALALALALTASASSALAAPVTFATFNQPNGSAPFSFTNNGGVSGTINYDFNVPVTFNFTGATGLGSQDRLAAVSIIPFTAGQPTTTVPAVAAGSLIDQPLNNSTIIRFTGVNGSDAGKNLLTMIFTGDIVGFSGSPTASLLGSKASGQTVIFSSDYIDFSPQLGNAYSFSLLNITPALSMGAGGFLNSFVSNIGGQFSSDIVVVPQPTSVAMFGTGIVATLVLASRRRLLRNKTA